MDAAVTSDVSCNNRELPVNKVRKDLKSLHEELFAWSSSLQENGLPMTSSRNFDVLPVNKVRKNLYSIHEDLHTWSDFLQKNETLDVCDMVSDTAVTKGSTDVIPKDKNEKATAVHSHENLYENPIKSSSIHQSISIFADKYRPLSMSFQMWNDSQKDKQIAKCSHIWDDEFDIHHELQFLASQLKYFVGIETRQWDNNDNLLKKHPLLNCSLIPENELTNDPYSSYLDDILKVEEDATYDSEDASVVVESSQFTAQPVAVTSLNVSDSVLLHVEEKHVRDLISDSSVRVNEYHCDFQVTEGGSTSSYINIVEELDAKNHHHDNEADRKKSSSDDAYDSSLVQTYSSSNNDVRFVNSLKTENQTCAIDANDISSEVQFLEKCTVEKKSDAFVSDIQVNFTSKDSSLANLETFENNNAGRTVQNQEIHTGSNPISVKQDDVNNDKLDPSFPCLPDFEESSNKINIESKMVYTDNDNSRAEIEERPEVKHNNEPVKNLLQNPNEYSLITDTKSFNSSSYDEPNSQFSDHLPQAELLTVSSFSNHVSSVEKSSLTVGKIEPIPSHDLKKSLSSSDCDSVEDLLVTKPVLADTKTGETSSCMVEEVKQIKPINSMNTSKSEEVMFLKNIKKNDYSLSIDTEMHFDKTSPILTENFESEKNLIDPDNKDNKSKVVVVEKIPLVCKGVSRDILIEEVEHLVQLDDSSPKKKFSRTIFVEEVKDSLLSKNAGMAEVTVLEKLQMLPYDEKSGKQLHNNKNIYVEILEPKGELNSKTTTGEAPHVKKIFVEEADGLLKKFVGEQQSTIKSAPFEKNLSDKVEPVNKEKFNDMLKKSDVSRNSLDILIPTALNLQSDAESVIVERPHQETNSKATKAFFVEKITSSSNLKGVSESSVSPQIAIAKEVNDFVDLNTCSIACTETLTVNGNESNYISNTTKEDEGKSVPSNTRIEIPCSESKNLKNAEQMQIDNSEKHVHINRNEEPDVNDSKQEQAGSFKFGSSAANLARRSKVLFEQKRKMFENDSQPLRKKFDYSVQVSNSGKVQAALQQYQTQSTSNNLTSVSKTFVSYSTPVTSIVTFQPKAYIGVTKVSKEECNTKKTTAISIEHSSVEATKHNHNSPIKKVAFKPILKENKDTSNLPENIKNTGSSMSVDKTTYMMVSKFSDSFTSTRVTLKKPALLPKPTLNLPTPYQAVKSDQFSPTSTKHFDTTSSATIISPKPWNAPTQLKTFNVGPQPFGSKAKSSESKSIIKHVVSPTSSTKKIEDGFKVRTNETAPPVPPLPDKKLLENIN